MGRRSNFPRIPKDFYATTANAVLPLVPLLKPGTRFIEPCAGDGALIRHLEARGHIFVGAFDIEPRRRSIVERDALTLTADEVAGADCFITNLPWSRPVLHALLAHLRAPMPLWTIIDANWANTIQAGSHMQRCSRMVSIGRVRWIPGTSNDGKDDSSWYRFEAEPAETVFTARAGRLMDVARRRAEVEVALDPKSAPNAEGAPDTQLHPRRPA